MMHLRARKQLEEILKKRLSSLELLHSTLHRVETSAGDIEVHRFRPSPISNDSRTFTDYESL